MNLLTNSDLSGQNIYEDPSDQRGLWFLPINQPDLNHLSVAGYCLLQERIDFPKRDSIAGCTSAYSHCANSPLDAQVYPPGGLIGDWRRARRHFRGY